jgi:hypothetical protein
VGVVSFGLRRPKLNGFVLDMLLTHCTLDARQFLALRRATAVSQNKMAAARSIGEHSIMTGCE